MSLHPNSLLTQMAEEKKDEKEIFVEGLRVRSFLGVEVG